MTFYITTFLRWYFLQLCFFRWKFLQCNGVLYHGLLYIVFYSIAFYLYNTSYIWSKVIFKSISSCKAGENIVGTPEMLNNFWCTAKLIIFVQYLSNYWYSSFQDFLVRGTWILFLLQHLLPVGYFRMAPLKR